MKRELKFRIWDNLKKTYLKKIRLHPIALDDGVSGFIQHPDGHTIEQFTGLRDKNKKEIFEGDIVTTSPSASCLTSILSPEDFTSYTRGQIKLVCGSWKVCQAYLGATFLYDFVDCECCPSYSIEVIGNIHENPEPLDSKLKND